MCRLVCVDMKGMVSLCQWSLYTMNHSDPRHSPCLLKAPVPPSPPFLTCSLLSSTLPSVSLFSQFCPNSCCAGSSKAMAESKMNFCTSCLLPQLRLFYWPHIKNNNSKTTEEDHNWHIWNLLPTMAWKTSSHLQANHINLEASVSEPESYNKCTQSNVSRDLGGRGHVLSVARKLLVCRELRCDEYR